MLVFASGTFSPHQSLVFCQSEFRKDRTKHSSPMDCRQMLSVWFEENKLEWNRFDVVLRRLLEYRLEKRNSDLWTQKLDAH